MKQNDNKNKHEVNVNFKISLKQYLRHKTENKIIKIMRAHLRTRQY